MNYPFEFKKPNQDLIDFAIKKCKGTIGIDFPYFGVLEEAH